MKGMNDRAVSEAIGFVLILGVMVSSIALVTLYGYPVLLKEQTNTDIRNMERGMIVLQNDVKSLCYKTVPYEETTLQVSGGTLSVADASPSPPSFDISTSDGYSTGEIFLGELRYHSDRGSEVITLENGAVLTRQEGQQGSTILAEPRWFYDEQTKTLVIFMIEFDAAEAISTSGMSTVQMSLVDPVPAPVERTHSAPGMTVTIGYTPDSDNDLSVGWKNYLTGTLGMTETTPGSNTYTLENVERLIIKSYTVRIHNI